MVILNSGVGSLTNRHIKILDVREKIHSIEAAVRAAKLMIQQCCDHPSEHRIKTTPDARHAPILDEMGCCSEIHKCDVCGKEWVDAK